MTPVTIDLDQLVGWGVSAYVFLHVLFGLVTHYHSVFQVRAYNKLPMVDRPRQSKRISSGKMFFFFLGRMIFGLPWFIATRVISPIGNSWHMTPFQISSFSLI